MAVVEKKDPSQRYTKEYRNRKRRYGAYVNIEKNTESTRLADTCTKNRDSGVLNRQKIYTNTLINHARTNANKL